MRLPFLRRSPRIRPIRNPARSSPTRTLRLEALEDRTVLTYASAINLQPGLFPGSAVAGDFLGNGKQQVIVAGGSSANPGLWLVASDGSGTFQPPVQISNLASL